MDRFIKVNDNPGSFYEHLQARKLIHNETPKIKDFLAESFAKGEVPSAYIGFDPSAPSLQVGNLLAALMLRRAQVCGIRPLILLGGATGLIGDPSGKKAERTLLERDSVQNNIEKIKAQLANVIDTDAGTYKAKFVNNHDWFKDFHYLDFLRDVGKHITVNYMLAKDSVKLRMETGISYAEFGYMLVQGYDFAELYKREGCLIQMGGSDQWGNMTTGIELIRRMHAKEAHAISAPLLTDKDGNKLGKSEGGAVYLDPDMTSPFQFFQFWLQLADSEVEKCLNNLTLFQDNYISELLEKVRSEPEKRAAQRILAHELTNQIHGADSAIAAESASRVLFSKDPESLSALGDGALKLLAQEVPSSKFVANTSISILDLLVETKLCKSKGEARKHIKGNAVSVNRVKLKSDTEIINKASFGSKQFILLGLGKQKLHLLLLVS